MTDPASLDAEAQAAIAAATAALRAAQSVLFITGAGMSADSGLPTYRGIGGLYQDRHTEDGFPIEVALSATMMRRRPEVTWRYIAEIEAACRGAGPNRGHRAIAELEARLPRVVVLTQNVEGLHQRAGSQKVIEIHGNVHRLRCTGCGARSTVESFEGLSIPPRCACGGLIRPEVVLFEEALPGKAIADLSEELLRGFDAVVSVGTTSVFPYIAAPVVQAAEQGRATIEINPGQSEVSEVVGIRIRTRAAVALDRIVGALLLSPGR